MSLDESEIKQQVDRLEAARRDPTLLKLMPRVIAAQFGAVPLARLAPDAIEAALPAGTHKEVVAGLSRALNMRIVASYFDENLVQLFVSRLYLHNESLNFHTFLEPDFLEREECLKLVREEKPMQPVEVLADGDPGRVAVLDYAYRSILESSDRRGLGAVNFEEQKEAATDLYLAVDTRGGEPHVRVARKTDVHEGVILIAQESYSYAGLQHMHGWRGHEVRELPHMIHPSEVQVTGTLPDGSIEVYVYDRIERVRPGETPRWDVTYHFMSMGQRLRRRLIVKIYGLWSVSRANVHPEPGAIPWSTASLERWLGHDLEA